MFTKSTVLCVAFFIQVLRCNTYDVAVLRNDAEKLLTKLGETVDNALVQAQNVLDKVKNKVNETTETIKATARTEMQSTEDKLEKELDTLKEKAANAGVNIDDCLAGNEDDLLNLTHVFSDNMVHCISDEINEGFKYAQDALDKIKYVVAEVENIKLQDCGSGFKAVKCLAKLVNIYKDVTSLPTQIKADAAATVVMFTQLVYQIRKCASDRVDDCEKEGEKLILTITPCVAGKIAG